MARRGGRRGRRSRSRQNRSRRTSSRTRSSSRRTSTRRSAPSSRRNTRGSGVKNRGRTATKARGTTNTRGSGAKNRGRTGVNASRGRAPTSRRQATRTTRQASPTRTNTRVARNQGPSSPIKNYGGKMLPNTGAGRPGAVRLKPKFQLPPATAFTNALMGINAAQAQPMNTRPKLLANLPKDYKKQEQELSAAADASRYKSLSIDQQRAIQQGKYGDTFGLNPVTQRNEINRIQNMIKAQNLARERQGLPATYSGQSLKEARDADGDGYADNMGNRIAGVYNATLGRLGLPNMPKQTVAGANISMNRPMGQRLPGLVSRRGSSGGASRIQQQAAATQMQPEIAPTIGTPTEGPLANLPFHGDSFGRNLEVGDPSTELNRIQNQAYNTQLTSSLANMFGGQGSVGYTPQGSPELSPTLRAGRSRGRRRVRLFGGRGRRGGTGDQFSRDSGRIARLTNINI